MIIIIIIFIIIWTVNIRAFSPWKANMYYDFVISSQVIKVTELFVLRYLLVLQNVYYTNR